MNEMNDNQSIVTFSLTDFVDELLEHICCLPTMGFKDVYNLSMTCQRLFAVTQSNKIWQEKWKHRYPTFALNVDRDDMQKVFKETILIERSLRKKLVSLSDYAYDYLEVPYRYLHEFDEIHNGDKEILHTIAELLYFFISEKNDTVDLNQKYYAQKVFYYVHRQKLKNTWEDLLSSEADDLHYLEKGAFLISQWCNPTLRSSCDEVSHRIDIITSHVREKLNGDSQDDVKVVRVINEVLYDEFGFQDNTKNYYDINNSFIDKVLELKLGIPITLSVVYIAVGKRLGLNIEGINFPGHFLIQLLPKEDGQTAASPIYIDAFHRGEMMDKDRCITRFISSIYYPGLFPGHMLFQVADNRKIFIRMVGNVINILKETVIMNSRNLLSLRAAHELMSILAPDDTNNFTVIDQIDQHLRLGLEVDQESEVIPKLRSSPENSDVQFRVGTVMKHKHYNYVCLIYGWDCVCRMDEAWQAQMNVHRLENKDTQPFYHVLADDKSSRYAAQENLVPTDSVGTGPISHPEVGKYFKSFNGISYILTEKLSKTYPED